MFASTTTHTGERLSENAVLIFQLIADHFLAIFNRAALRLQQEVEELQAHITRYVLNPNHTATMAHGLVPLPSGNMGAS
jgi:5-carboxymethyl-2-hydroxymuconate isomerase